MEITNETMIMQLARQDNKFLGGEELPKNSDLIVTIANIVQEAVLNPKNNKTSNKTTVYFTDGVKPMVANKTNLTAIYRATGVETVGEAIGHKIALYFDPTVRFGGNTTGGIRVSSYSPGTPEYERDCAKRDEMYGRQKPIICTGCGKVIHGAGGKTASEVAAWSKKEFGKTLCLACMKKEKEKKA